MGEEKMVVEAMKAYRICIQGSYGLCKPNRFSIGIRVFQNYFSIGWFGLSQMSQCKFAQVKRV